MKEHLLYFLSGCLLTALVFTFLQVAFADAPNPGHTADEIEDLPASKITSGVFDTARLGSGTSSSSTFLRGDQIWTAVRECPSGFTDTGYGYCIQTDEANSGTGLTFWNASDYCADNHGARLCSSSEWYSACINGVLTNGTDDDEWVDAWHRCGTVHAPMVLGDGACATVGDCTYVYNPDFSVAFRCCW